MTYAFVSAVVIMLASLSGAIFTAKRYGPWTERNLKYLVSFSIGVFAVIVFGLLQESFEEQSLLLVLVSVIGGAVALELLSLLIPKAHHHHGMETGHGHSHIDARRMLLGDAVHNFGDGLILVPAFAIGIETGLIATLGIFIHELVQEISEFFVLKEAGYTNKQALIRNFAVSSTILLGVVVSLALSSSEEIAHFLTAFAAGGFIHIIFRDLVPHTMSSMKKEGKKIGYAGALIAGIALMSTVTFLAPHSHEHEGEIHIEEEIVAPRA